MGLFRRKLQALTLRAQLDALKKCGVRLRDGFTIRDLLDSGSREEYEATPFLLALAVMGAECETDHQRGFLSNDVWYFDSECICAHGSYSDIVERLCEISGGDFPAKNIRDFVDLDKEKAWVEFELDSATHRFNATVDNDWLDIELFGWIEGLLQQRGARRKLFDFVDCGQCFLTGWADAAMLDCLRRTTGRQIDWLVR